MNLPRSVHTDTAVGRVIQTRYGGHYFRSRTEARWAVFFDTLGVRWDYELEGFVLHGKPYLPDFFIHEWDAWFEVKPEVDRQFAHTLVHTLGLVRRLTYAKEAYVCFGSPELIRSNFISSECCVFTHVDVDGPTHRAPEEGKAYEAYRRAMEERFNGAAR